MALVVSRLLSRRADVAEMVGVISSAVKRAAALRRAKAAREEAALIDAAIFDSTVLEMRSKAEAQALIQSSPEVMDAPQSLKLNEWVLAAQARVARRRRRT